VKEIAKKTENRSGQYLAELVRIHDMGRADGTFCKGWSNAMG
jgi:hypothetical protein